MMVARPRSHMGIVTCALKPTTQQQKSRKVILFRRLDKTKSPNEDQAEFQIPLRQRR